MDEEAAGRDLLALPAYLKSDIALTYHLTRC